MIEAIIFLTIILLYDSLAHNEAREEGRYVRAND